MLVPCVMKFLPYVIMSPSRRASSPVSRLDELVPSEKKELKQSLYKSFCLQSSQFVVVLHHDER